MSRKRQQLQKVLRVAQDDLALAEQKLSMEVTKLNHAKAMSVQLQNFRQSQPALQGTVSALQFQTNQNFLYQIDAAIEKQDEMFPLLSADIEKARDVVKQKQSRAKALERLLDKILEAEKLRATRRQMREAADVMAMRAMFNKGAD